MTGVTVQGSVPYPPTADASRILRLASELGDVGSALGQGSTQVSATTRTALSTWSGDAAAAFEQRMQDRAGTLATTAQTLARAVPVLTTYAAAIASTQASYSAAAAAEHAARAGLPWTSAALAAALAAEGAAVATLQGAGMACGAGLGGVAAQVVATHHLTGRGGGQPVTADATSGSTIDGWTDIATDIWDWLFGEQVDQGAVPPVAVPDADRSVPPQPLAPPAPAPQADGLDPRVVDSIMASEGAAGEQGGRLEVYGFRSGNGPAYDEIMTARRTFGRGSAQEREVVERHLAAAARTAGAFNFRDPSVQAAIISGAHMRGAGGVRATLNLMVQGGPVERSARLEPATIESIAAMSPEEFQRRFREARIEYDRAIYGHTTTTRGGRRGNWWEVYGRGLTDRYEREEREFLQLTQVPD